MKYLEKVPAGKTIANDGALEEKFAKICSWMMGSPTVRTLVTAIDTKFLRAEK